MADGVELLIVGGGKMGEALLGGMLRCWPQRREHLRE